MPTWQEVLPETELSDIKWIKPKVKRAEVFEHKFKSSSNDKVYTTKRTRICRWYTQVQL